MKLHKTLCLAAFTLALPAAHAATIFSHTFNNGTGTLNGTAVNEGTGSWVSPNIVNADGVFNSGTGDGARGSATLAFSPLNGLIYELDTRITDITGNNDWVGFGFANGQSTSIDRFITDNVVGTAWMFFRGDNTDYTNDAYRGNGTLGAGDHGLTDGSDWSAFNTQDGTTPGSIDMRIVLDTTGGSGNWKVTWLAKELADANYTTVRPEAAVLNETNFTSVGYAFAGEGTNGELESFSLTAIPEPSAAIISALGLLAFLRRRR